MPATSSVDRTLKAAGELATSLSNPALAVLFHTVGDEILEALQQFSDIFSSHSKATQDTKEPEHEAVPQRVENNVPLNAHKKQTVHKAPAHRVMEPHAIPEETSNTSCKPFTVLQNTKQPKTMEDDINRHTPGPTHNNIHILPDDRPIYGYITRYSHGHVNSITVIEQAEDTTLCKSIINKKAKST